MKAARHFIVLAGILGALGVCLGAFAAHGLKARLTPEMLSVFEVGVRYHFYHALALLTLGAVRLHTGPSRGLAVAGGLWLTGAAIFSGSLYALALTGMGWFGAITPVGGMAFIAGWLALAASAWRLQASPQR